MAGYNALPFECREKILALVLVPTHSFSVADIRLSYQTEKLLRGSAYQGCAWGIARIPDDFITLRQVCRAVRADAINIVTYHNSIFYGSYNYIYRHNCLLVAKPPTRPIALELATKARILAIYHDVSESCFDVLRLLSQSTPIAVQTLVPQLHDNHRRPDLDSMDLEN